MIVLFYVINRDWTKSTWESEQLSIWRLDGDYLSGLNYYSGTANRILSIFLLTLSTFATFFIDLGSKFYLDKVFVIVGERTSCGAFLTTSYPSGERYYLMLIREGLFSGRMMYDPKEALWEGCSWTGDASFIMGAFNVALGDMQTIGGDKQVIRGDLIFYVFLW